MAVEPETAPPAVPADNRPTNWPPALHKLAGVGPLTRDAVTHITTAEPAFGRLAKLGDDVLAEVADALGSPWADGPAARLLTELDRRLGETGHDVHGAGLGVWVRAHPNDPEAVTECAMLLPPDAVEVLARLSERGSQKRVFLATWRQGRREVVLKQVRGSRAEQESVMGRELQSHPLVMRHPNVIATLPLANARGDKFLVEEKLPRVLDDRWRANGLQEAAGLLHDVARALAYLHGDLRLIHGDIKPDNIGWKGGAYILLDFGICRKDCEFTRDATATGSLRTRAPELFLTDRYDDPGKADVWSLGATVFNAMVGRFPFVDDGEKVPRISNPPDRAEFEALVRRRIEGEWAARVSLADVPEPLRGVLYRVLTRDPGERVTAKGLVRLCEHRLAGFLREAGAGSVAADVELEQLLRHLPRRSLRSMPTARRQELAERLRLLRQVVPPAGDRWSEVDDLLKSLE